MLLRIQHLSKYFDNKRVKALENVSFEVEAGKTYAIVGESGSGKTTLARLIAGLERPDRGRIYLHTNLVASESYFLPPEKRKVGLVFQDYALFPHLTVAKNIEYGIAKAKDKKQIVQSMLDLVNLAGYEKRYPHELSGGQQQRVALARALAPQPQLLLLDEPFSNLDSSLRIQLRTELFRILQQAGVCSIFVTHDTQDALAVADEILILKAGQLLQQATPPQLYQQPATPYIAELFDPIVLLPLSLLTTFGYTPASNQQYYLRCRHLHIEDAVAPYQATAVVKRSTFMGVSYTVHLKIGNHALIAETNRAITAQQVRVGWYEKDLLCFEQPLEN